MKNPKLICFCSYQSLYQGFVAIDSDTESITEWFISTKFLFVLSNL